MNRGRSVLSRPYYQVIAVNSNKQENNANKALIRSVLPHHKSAMFTMFDKKQIKQKQNESTFSILAVKFFSLSRTRVYNMCLPKQITGDARQRFAATIGSLLCLNFGLMFGISIVHIELYQSIHPRLKSPLNFDEANTILTCLFYGVGLGAVVLGSLWQFMGSKGVMLLSGLLQIGGWGCLHFASDILHIYSSRLLVGFSAGAAFVVLPIFIKDVSEYYMESKLIAALDNFRTFGIFAGIILGQYLSDEIIPLVGLLIAMIFQLLFAFIEESPYHYITNKDVNGLEKCLRWYRGIRSGDDTDRPDFRSELEQLKKKMKNQTLISTTITLGFKVKMFIIAFILSLGSQFNGAYVFLYLGNDLLDGFNGQLTDYHVLILALIQLIGAITATQIALRARRKLVILISTLLCSLALIIFALLIHLGSRLQTFPYYMSWLSYVILWIHIFVLNIGLQSFVIIFLNELLPREICGRVLGLAYAFSCILLALSIQFFKELSIILSLPGCILIYAVACILVMIFCAFFLPETKSELSEDIQSTLGRDRSNGVARSTNVLDGHITINDIRY